MSKRISVVVPSYNELESIPQLIQEIESALSDWENYEIIFVDDGSKDGTIDVLKQKMKENTHIHVLHSPVNYGKSAALNAGFQKSTGDFVISIDSDLQDDPTEIHRMVELLEKGFDMVSGWKKDRQDPISKTLPSKLFNTVTRWLTGVNLHDFNCGLKAYRKQLAKSLELYGGLHRYIPAIAVRDGYQVTEMIVHHRPRKFGQSKFGRERYFHGFFDLITVLFLGRYTRKPLHFFGIFGFIGIVLGFGVNLWVVYLKYGLHEPFVKHLALLIFGILLILLGVQFVSIGLLGEMIAKANFRREPLRYDELQP